MSTFILKRKIFADAGQYQQKSKKSTGAKFGLGLLAAAGTAAGGFYGARKGMLGNNLAMRANKAWGNLGARFGSEGMMKSGAEGFGKFKAAERIGEKPIFSETLRKKGLDHFSKKYGKEALKSFEQKAAEFATK